jgi:class 3 adenylate cyclase
VSRLHLLAVTGGTTDELLRDRGEAGACAALREAERAFAELVLAHEGTVLASALDTLVAAFPSGARAARAAMALLGRDGSLLLRAGLHGGRCFALTRQGRVDYWGEVVHRATWLARAAAEGELVLSHQAAGERDVAWELHRLGAAPRVDVADAGPYAGRRIVRVRPR